MSDLTHRRGGSTTATFAGVCLATAIAGWLALAPRVHAQDAEDLQAAAEAFQQGQRAQVRGDFAQAAEMFDLANHTAPSAAALRSAIRMHQSAGHHAAAATRAAHALTTYPEDAATVQLANEVLAGCGPLLGHLIVRCDPACSLTVAGRAVSGSTTEVSLYVDPGAHELRATWGDRALARSVETTAGSEHPVTLALADAPAASIAGPVSGETGSGETGSGESGSVETGTGTTTAGASSGGVSPAFFAIAAGLTVASLATAIGVGVDMLSARDAYVLMPTETGWSNGVGRETATNALIGTTIGLAAVTLVLALVTDWDGDAPSSDSQASVLSPRLSLGASHDGAQGSLTFAF